MNYFYSILMLSGMLFSLAAQPSVTKRELVFKEKSAVLNAKAFSAEVEIGLYARKFPSDKMVVVTPLLESSDGKQVHVFEPVALAGTKRAKAFRRSEVLSGKKQMDLVVVKNSAAYPLFVFHLNAPRSSWMKDARLVFFENWSGCANCDLGEGKSVIELPKIEPYIPRYNLSFIVPEAEPVKERSKKYSARFTYRVADATLLTRVGNNEDELNKIKEMIDEVRTDRNLELTSIAIVGYASPEGSVQNNLLLSERRAKSFADYLRIGYGLNKDMLSIDWKGEDWNGLREAVSASSIQNKHEILMLIDYIRDVAERKRQIMFLSGGDLYRKLLSDIYPSLRRNELTLNFKVKAFDVEEAKEMIAERPQYLSLNEMYLVANSYPVSSKEFKEVFEIAAKQFPEDEVAALNAAAVGLENGELDMAIERLQKSDRPEALNNLGIAYARKGYLEKARELFAAAAEAGDENARENQKEIKKAIED